MTTATIIRTYSPDLMAVAVNGKVAVATITRDGAVSVEATTPLTTAERDAVAAAARKD